MVKKKKEIKTELENELTIAEENDENNPEAMKIALESSKTLLLKKLKTQFLEEAVNNKEFLAKLEKEGIELDPSLKDYLK